MTVQRKSIRAQLIRPERPMELLLELIRLLDQFRTVRVVLEPPGNLGRSQFGSINVRLNLDKRYGRGSELAADLRASLRVQ